MNLKNKVLSTIAGLGLMTGVANAQELKLPVSPYEVNKTFTAPEDKITTLHDIDNLDEVFMNPGDAKRSGNIDFLRAQMITNGLNQPNSNFSPTLTSVSLPDKFYADGMAGKLPAGMTLDSLMNKMSSQDALTYLQQNNLFDVPVTIQHQYTVMGEKPVQFNQGVSNNRFYNISRLLAKDLAENGNEADSAYVLDGRVVKDNSARGTQRIGYLPVQNLLFEATATSIDIPKSTELLRPETFYDGQSEMDDYANEYYAKELINAGQRSVSDGSLIGLGVKLEQNADSSLAKLTYYPLVEYTTSSTKTLGEVVNRLTNDQDVNRVRASVENIAMNQSRVESCEQVDGFLYEKVDAEKKKQSTLDRGFYVQGLASLSGVGAGFGYDFGPVHAGLNVAYTPKEITREAVDVQSTQLPPNLVYTQTTTEGQTTNYNLQIVPEFGVNITPKLSLTARALLGPRNVTNYERVFEENTVDGVLVESEIANESQTTNTTWNLNGLEGLLQYKLNDNVELGVGAQQMYLPNQTTTSPTVNVRYNF